MIIYKIVNKINNKIYIGQTNKTVSERVAQHIALNKTYIQKALNKYGVQSFDISIIDSAESREILSERNRTRRGIKPNWKNPVERGRKISASHIKRNS